MIHIGVHVAVGAPAGVGAGPPVGFGPTGVFIAVSVAFSTLALVSAVLFSRRNLED